MDIWEKTKYTDRNCHLHPKKNIESIHFCPLSHTLFMVICISSKFIINFINSDFQCFTSPYAHLLTF